MRAEPDISLALLPTWKTQVLSCLLPFPILPRTCSQGGGAGWMTVPHEALKALVCLCFCLCLSQVGFYLSGNCSIRDYWTPINIIHPGTQASWKEGKLRTWFKKK